jgi:uncharacterized protein YukE
MRSGANDVSNAVNQMDQEMATFERSMMAAYEQWDGPARNAFDDARLQWKSIQQDLHARLALVGQAVTGSATEFEANEMNMARTTPGVIQG